MLIDSYFSERSCVQMHVNIYLYMSYNMPYAGNSIIPFSISVLQPAVLEQ